MLPLRFQTKKKQKKIKKQKMTSKSAAAANGQALWAKAPKVNAELFALTYGALVTEVVGDADGNVDEINEQLEKIGYNIGYV